MPFTTGFRLGSYEITGAIGAGGMGEVYGGRDSKLNPPEDSEAILSISAIAKSARTHPRFLLEYFDDELIDLERKAQKSGPPSHQLRWRVVCYKINLLTNAESVK